MGRYKARYARPDAAGAAIKLPSFQQLSPASTYAAARFQEWQANADVREALLNARLQQAQSQAEMAGARFRYDLWKDNELRAQTTHYYNAMPALQQDLKQAGIYPGSQRYAAEMAAFASTLPDAITHNESIRKELEDFSKVDATAEQIADKIKTFQEGMEMANQRTGTIHYSKEGAISGEGRTALPEQVLERYAKLQGNIAAHTEQSDIEKQQNIKSGRANVPFSKAAELHADQIESSILERNFPQLNPSAQQATTTATQQVTPTPSPTPSATPSPTPSIEVGTRRTANGQMVEWDGQGWSAVQQ